MAVLSWDLALMLRIPRMADMKVGERRQETAFSPLERVGWQVKSLPPFLKKSI